MNLLTAPPIHLPLSLLRRPFLRPRTLTLRRQTLTAAAAAAPPPPPPPPPPVSIDMARGRDGVYTVREPTVVVLWDLDNKPPRGPPYPAAVSLRRLAELCGRVLDISAYANRHAFTHLPSWVRDDRRDRRHLDILERKGLSAPADPYLCGVCGRKCRTNLDLKKHFRQLHEREREKKLSRMRSLKGKKRQRYRERFISGNEKYNEAARTILRPKVGYGLAPELRRAGVYVRTVEDKPQAADAALKRQMQHSMARGADWLFLVSDDSDFTDMIRRAREAGLRTVVVGDGRRSLGSNAEFWVPWTGVENGEVREEALFSQRTGFGEDEDGDSLYSTSLYEDSDCEDSEVGYLDDVVEEIVDGHSGSGVARISAFSEEDGGWEEEEDGGWDSDKGDGGYI